MKTFCRICQAYCGLKIEVEAGAVTRVRADGEHPVSQGYSCTKGRALGELHRHPRRLLAHRLGGSDAPWPLVIDDLTARLRRIVDEHGPDAVAFDRGTASYFDSAGLVALGALIAGLGSRSLYTTSTIDQVARFWVAELLCGMHSALPLIDQDGARLTILVGTNPPVSHGHVNSWPDPISRLRRLAAQGELWCVDVRATETSAIAQHHLTPRPGSDWAILGHAVRELLIDGADQQFVADHTRHIDTLRAAVEPLDRSRASELAGVPGEDLDRLVGAIRRNGRVAVQTGTGATMARQGDVTEWMAWALMAVTGSLDRPGGVWFSPGFLRPRRTPGSPLAEPGPLSRPDLLGRFGERPTAALVDEIETGQVRALIVTGGNPLRAVPGSTRLARAFSQLEVLAVADILDGPTVTAATHVLACAAQLERPDMAMVETMYPVPASQYTPALIAPPGEARPLFELLSDLSVGLGVTPAATSAESLFDELAGARGEPLRRERILLGAADFGWFTEQIVPGRRWALAPEPLVTRLAAALATSAGLVGGAPAGFLLTHAAPSDRPHEHSAGGADRPTRPARLSR